MHSVLCIDTPNHATSLQPRHGPVQTAPRLLVVVVVLLLRQQLLQLQLVPLLLPRLLVILLMLLLVLTTTIATSTPQSTRRKKRARQTRRTMTRQKSNRSSGSLVSPPLPLCLAVSAKARLRVLRRADATSRVGKPVSAARRHPAHQRRRGPRAQPHAPPEPSIEHHTSSRSDIRGECA